jgi:hypothetical protein
LILSLVDLIGFMGSVFGLAAAVGVAFGVAVGVD